MGEGNTPVYERSGLNLLSCQLGAEVGRVAEHEVAILLAGTFRGCAGRPPRAELRVGLSFRTRPWGCWAWRI